MRKPNGILKNKNTIKIKYLINRFNRFHTAEEKINNLAAKSELTIQSIARRKQKDSKQRNKRHWLQ